MLRLSKKMLFALEAVVDIAYNAGTDPVQSKEITRRQGIPQRYLEQVMQRLVRAGIQEECAVRAADTAWLANGAGSCARQAAARSPVCSTGTRRYRSRSPKFR